MFATDRYPARSTRSQGAAARAARFLAVALAFSACGGAANPFVGDGGGPLPGDAALSAGADLAIRGAPDLAAAMGVDDGAPMRASCTATFGSALDISYGRLDGFLRAIVPPGNHACHGDSSHVHLQIEMSGSIYDVAINVRDRTGGEVLYRATDLALPEGAWSEGWHTGAVAFDYVAEGDHANQFSAISESALATALASELKSANHISVFMTGYGGDGGHLIHRNGNGHDGAIVINPLSPTSRMLLFHFVNQNF